MCSSVAQKNPNEGPPKSSRPPSGWPSPSAMSAPVSPRRSQHPQRHRVDRDDDERLRLLRPSGERRDVLDRAEEVRRLEEHRRGVLVHRLGELRGIGDSAAEPDLVHGGAVPLRVRHERLTAVWMQPARGHEPSPAGDPGREVSGRGDRRWPLVKRRVRDRQASEVRTSRSGTRTSPGGGPGRPPAGTACTA